MNLASLGRAKRPPSTIFAPGSTPLIAALETFTSFPYSTGLGLTTKYLKFSSFQICQVRIGRAGTEAWVAQNVPPGP